LNCSRTNAPPEADNYYRLVVNFVVFSEHQIQGMAKSKSDQYIFLVDDEPIQNEMLKDFLSEKFDYAIKTYDNGESALKDIQQLRPQLIVLDYHLNAHLPEARNGIDVLKMFKDAYADAKVIMLSGQDRIEVAIDSMKYGAFDYVIKGETAFSRMENIINYIGQVESIQAANKTYKNIIIGFIIAFILVIAASFYLVVKMR
jgi:two-component system, OmpR family, response regulator